MEDFVALILIFGGGTVVALSMSPIGRALADRIRGHSATGSADEVRRLRESQEDMASELESVRHDVGELQERLDFTERLLARKREDPAFPPQPNAERPVQG
jgi:hypothetical protein